MFFWIRVIKVGTSEEIAGYLKLLRARFLERGNRTLETTKPSPETGFLNKWRSGWTCTQLDLHSIGLAHERDSLVVDQNNSAKEKALAFLLGLCLNKWRSGRDSNPRPPAWQAGILTNWTTAPHWLDLKSKFKAWRCPTLTWGSPTLPSALIRFTSEFGMEVRWVQIAMVAKQIL